MKDKATALILCIFLGGFGIHRFYLGRTSSGLIRLLFCWTLIPSLIACIEIFTIAFMSPEAFDEKYNSGKSSLPSGQTATEALAKLGDLFKQDLLSKEEYETKKTELLKKIN